MNSNFDPDIGGGTGYSLAFTDKDSYASTQNYFTPSTQWPVTAMTLSVWLRWVGVSPGGIRTWAFTALAANDPNHVQVGLNVVQREKNWLPNVEIFSAEVSSFTPVINLNSFSGCWTHVTMTYNLTGLILMLFSISPCRRFSLWYTLGMFLHIALSP